MLYIWYRHSLDAFSWGSCCVPNTLLGSQREKKDTPVIVMFIDRSDCSSKMGYKSVTMWIPKKERLLSTEVGRIRRGPKEGTYELEFGLGDIGGGWRKGGRRHLSRHRRKIRELGQSRGCGDAINRLVGLQMRGMRLKGELGPKG